MTKNDFMLLAIASMAGKVVGEDGTIDSEVGYSIVGEGKNLAYYAEKDGIVFEE